MDKILRYAAYAGIIYLILTIISIVLSIIELLGPSIDYLKLTSLALVAAIGMAEIVLFWGLKVLGEKTQNKLLEYVSLAGIASAFPITGYSLAQELIDLSPTVNMISSLLVMILIGLLNLVFGIALLKLKDKFGNLATATAILGIITGITELTIILSPIGILTGLIAGVLEVIILWKASNTY